MKWVLVGVLLTGGVVALASLWMQSLWRQQEQGISRYWRRSDDVLEGREAIAMAAAGGAVAMLVLQSLWRRTRNRGSAAEYEKTLVRDLDMLMRFGLHADVTLVVGETKLKAHRAILAIRGSSLGCEVGSYQSEDKTDHIVIRDTEPDVLRALLVYLYTDEAHPDPQMAQKLIVAADKYNVSTLKKHCERIISQNLCVENAAEYAVLAVRHSCDRLEESCTRFIAAHFDQVMASEGWHRVQKNYPYNALTITRRVAEASLQTRTRCALQ